ncbi:inactive protein kinase SELMODRAFT_444075-like isoform X1 [Solanum stenotomum]|uniref:inactive protein kinase SELMODRAFT_444075-like isoform X1 n=1 Tax=Solanum stenotomum TaxID=172797 RepID=UPI0020D1110C|nr:inactive protein kinase SELMODRAFT_444075-like isoform X1 [Solanum stenotomum]
MFPPKPQRRTQSMPRGISPNLADKVIVAVKAEKVINKTALAWAITHVVRPGDCITLLAVFSDEKSERRRFWGFPRMRGDCRSNERTHSHDRIGQITESCSQMVLQFHDRIDVRVRIKVVSALCIGVVAAEAKSNAVSWVILDKKLKLELKHCMEELRCNIVVMKGSKPKVLRLNLGSSEELQTPFFSANSSPVLDSRDLQDERMKHSTPVSSPEDQRTSYIRTSLLNSLTDPDKFLLYERNPLYEGLDKETFSPVHKQSGRDHPVNDLPSFGERIITLSTVPKSQTHNHKTILWIPQNDITADNYSAVENCKSTSHSVTSRNENQNFIGYNKNLSTQRSKLNRDTDMDYVNSGIREAVSLGRTSSIPPPLCSFCQCKAPSFGKPPKLFHYEELQEATNGFSDRNFLAEGGFGLVHKGVLRDGLVVAVKQLKFIGSQADADFRREVRVLSCAQHRNVVLLVGYCIQGNRRLFVYEFICNKSLDFHLHGTKETALDWSSRLKIAIGTARGLRYLHEDCRVGCIVHRDLRPKNILLTHDFEPLVADFGLSQMYNEWEVSEDDEHLIRTSRYLAPEYSNDGKVTEKVDVYAFGLVVLELITGRKTTDLQCYSGQHLLPGSLSPISGKGQYLSAFKNQLLDSNLTSSQLENFPYELQAMSHAAYMCLQEDPHLRPPISKVLKILEGGRAILDSNSFGSRSGYMQGTNSNNHPVSKRHSRRLSY